MNTQTKFILQVFLATAFLLAALGYTAAISQAFVSPTTVLNVIQK